MVAYVVRDADLVFDPAVGAGAFAAAVQRHAKKSGREIRFAGCELDEKVLIAARELAVDVRDLREVQVADFLHLRAIPESANIVANPPYIRHHRLSADQKTELKALGAKHIGKPLDGRAGIHVFFLIHALSLLGPERCLSFIMPADTCEGVFAKPLWEWIGRRFCLETVITFAPVATPFPGVDTNPVVFMIRNSPPSTNYVWARCLRPGGNELRDWVCRGFPVAKRRALMAERRSLAEGIASGVARERVLKEPPKYFLADFAKTMRGIATGANEYFWLTRQQINELGIADEFLVRAVGRTRDVSGDAVRLEDLDKLESAGRPTHLFVPDARPMNSFAEPTRRYLQLGVDLGLPKRALIAQRRPWYKMERRIPPPFLFAYLGRRNARFIKNDAAAWPLTGFLCVYPHEQDEDFLARLWRVLQSEEIRRNLLVVGKSYGAGAVKVEPRALEKLPLPTNVVEGEGLDGWLRTRARSAKGQLLLEW
jgi:SAM-dependent methyltransferase